MDGGGGGIMDGCRMYRRSRGEERAGAEEEQENVVVVRTYIVQRKQTVPLVHGWVCRVSRRLSLLPHFLPPLPQQYRFGAPPESAKFNDERREADASRPRSVPQPPPIPPKRACAVGGEVSVPHPFTCSSFVLPQIGRDIRLRGWDGW